MYLSSPLPMTVPSLTLSIKGPLRMGVYGTIKRMLSLSIYLCVFCRRSVITAPKRGFHRNTKDPFGTVTFISGG